MSISSTGSVSSGTADATWALLLEEARLPPGARKVLDVWGRGESLLDRFLPDDLFALCVATPLESAPDLVEATSIAWVVALCAQGTVKGACHAVCVALRALRGCSVESFWSHIEAGFEQLEEEDTLLPSVRLLLAREVHETGITALLPATAGCRPLLLRGPEGEAVVARDVFVRRFGDSSDIEPMLQQDGNCYDLRHLPVEAFRALYRYLTRKVDGRLAGGIVAMPYLYALADEYQALPLKEVVADRARVLLIDRYNEESFSQDPSDTASWQEMVQSVSALMTMGAIESEELLASCLRALPAIALQAATWQTIDSATVDAWLVLFAQAPPIEGSEDLFGWYHPLRHPSELYCYPARHAATCYTKLYDLLIAHVSRLPAAAFEERQEALLPFIAQCVLNGFGVKYDVWEEPFHWEGFRQFIEQPRATYSSALRALLLELNKAFAAGGEAIRQHRTWHQVLNPYFTAETQRAYASWKVSHYGAVCMPACGPNLQTLRAFEHCVEALQEAQRTGRFLCSSCVATACECEAMHILEQLLDGPRDTVRGICEGLAALVARPSSQERYQGIIQAFTRLVGGSGDVEIILVAMRFFVGLAQNGPKVAESLAGPYQELHALLPPQRWYEVNSELYPS